jgi:hypothetical protein
MTRRRREAHRPLLLLLLVFRLVVDAVAAFVVSTDHGCCGTATGLTIRHPAQLYHQRYFGRRHYCGGAGLLLFSTRMEQQLSTAIGGGDSGIASSSPNNKKQKKKKATTTTVGSSCSSRPLPQNRNLVLLEDRRRRIPRGGGGGMDAPSNNDNHNRKQLLAEYGGLGLWMTSLSCFLLYNHYVGPWPDREWYQSVTVPFFKLLHALSAMMFGGGIVVTTCLEWWVVASSAENKNNATTTMPAADSLLQFYFSQVPYLDALIVLPALTTSIVSGVGLSILYYGQLGAAPSHIRAAITTLLLFAIWWAVTDVATQDAAGRALRFVTDDVNDDDDRKNGVAVAANNNNQKKTKDDIPHIVRLRQVSNVISCGFVVALYAIMVLKPQGLYGY